MADFRKLLVWQKAHALAVDTHRARGRIRGKENAALRSQITRAAQSIPANIVEGRSQASEREFARFLGYAIGSASELEYHLMIAKDIAALSATDAMALTAQLIEVRKMLIGLRASLGPGAGRPASAAPTPRPRS